jgi:hypothetical protein
LLLIRSLCVLECELKLPSSIRSKGGDVGGEGLSRLSAGGRVRRHHAEQDNVFLLPDHQHAIPNGHNFATIPQISIGEVSEGESVGTMVHCGPEKDLLWTKFSRNGLKTAENLAGPVKNFV